MDLTLLQKTLRQFAAERDWQAFHTPKNLAMALMVEAAELAEIFQWMTPEQSQTAHGDTLVQERIGDEVADVLLYLLQLADHSAIDLKRVVGRKLVKNAKKHPPVKPGLPAGPAAALETPTHVLVDWENVQPHDTDILRLVPDATHVWIFHGRQQRRAGAHQLAFGDNLTLVPVSRPGKNALDFHLSFYMGYITSRNPQARIVVLSNDQGYGPMLDHARDLGFAASQLGFTKARSPARKTSGGRSASAKTAPMAAPVAAPVAARIPARAPGRAPAPVPAPEKATGKTATPANPKPGSATPPAHKRASPRRKATSTSANPATEQQVPDTPLASVTTAETPTAPSPTQTPPLTPAKKPRPARKPTRNAPAAPAASAAPAPPEPAAPKPKAARPRRGRAGETPAATPQPAASPMSEKDYQHIVKSLQKGRDKPTRQARLLGMVRSHLPGGKADDALVAAVVARLVAEQRVQIDAKGAVSVPDAPQPL